MLRADLDADSDDAVDPHDGAEQSTSGGNRREHTRYDTNWPARCIVDNAFVCKVVIENTSDGGFGLSRSLPVDVGTRMMISIDQIGVFACRLAWKNHERCGVQLFPDNGCFSDVQVVDFDVTLRPTIK